MFSERPYFLTPGVFFLITSRLLSCPFLQSPVGISELTVSVDLIDTGHYMTGHDMTLKERTGQERRREVIRKNAPEDRKYGFSEKMAFYTR